MQKIFSGPNRPVLYDGLVHVKYSMPQIFVLAQFGGLINSWHKLRRYEGRYRSWTYWSVFIFNEKVTSFEPFNPILHCRIWRTLIVKRIEHIFVNLFRSTSFSSNFISKFWFDVLTRNCTLTLLINYSTLLC